MRDKPHVVILGAGPAGLGAAYRLSQDSKAKVTVLERQERVGGNAASFEVSGVRVDFGSHRLHPASEPHLLEDIRSLLGDDLLTRPRHGRIRLRGRWIHFPLKPVDLALRLPPSFALGVAGDSARRLLPSAPDTSEETFASILEDGLGRTICRDFYFPYARKIWGVEPEVLSPVQARRRVSAGSLKKMVGKVLAAVPGVKRGPRGIFYYPRRGFGQISEAYAAAAESAGADLRLGASVRGLDLTGSRPCLMYESEGVQHTLEADYVWSTIPLTVLARGVQPAPPTEVLEAVETLDFRAMILIYLVLEQDQFTEFDAHYFPEAEIAITRLSEPKNYSGTVEPRGRTVLCAELPCSPDDAVWTMDDAALGELVVEALAKAGLSVTAPVAEVVTRRLPQAYPIYENGYDEAFDRLDDWFSGLDRVLTFGRQGLFAHDNTHHALYMAYAAVECFGSDGRFDSERWEAYRSIFATHVVED